jgi:hypothetical protein
MGGTVVSCNSGDDGGGITIGIVRFWLLGNAIGLTDVVTVSSGVVGLGVVVVAIVVGLGGGSSCCSGFRSCGCGGCSFMLL